MEADLGHELGEARVGAERVGHGLSTQIDEAVVALLVGAIKPVEGRSVFAETSVNGGEVERGNVPRLGKVMKFAESFASATGVASESKRVSVQGSVYIFFSRRAEPSQMYASQ